MIDALTQKMSEQQVLFAPKVAADNWATDAEVMTAEHVLVEVQDQNYYRFFHESFFDYAYARRFCASGRGVVEFLISTEQQLFRRAQVRQILAYRREHDVRRYIEDVREVLGSPEVRFHIKRMVASGFHQIDEPTRDEWLVLEPYLLEGDLSRYVSGTLRNHLGWFDLLDDLRVFRDWLASGEDRFTNAAIWFLEPPDLHDSRSERIAELIAPYVDRADGWPERIIRIMSWGKGTRATRWLPFTWPSLAEARTTAFRAALLAATFGANTTMRKKNARSSSSMSSYAGSTAPWRIRRRRILELSRQLPTESLARWSTADWEGGGP